MYIVFYAILQQHKSKINILKSTTLKLRESKS